ncbi:MAG: hypothetical protein ACTSVL_07905 [Promethearchaeota archaeon]
MSEKKEEAEIHEKQADKQKEISDEEFASVYGNLKEDIINRHINAENHLAQEVYCKLCGRKFKSDSTVKNCAHCKIPVCKECRTNEFCLNCWINLSDDARKTLSLLKLMCFTVPILTLFVLFQGIVAFLIAEAVMNIIDLFLYFFSKYFILKHASNYFKPQWEEVIQKPEYRDYFDRTSPKRYLHPKMIEDFNRKRAKHAKSLHDWVDPKLKLEDIPKPAYIDKMEEEIGKEGVDDFLVKKFYAANNQKEKSSIEVKYKLIGKACPICGKIIQFADFCAECNRKFCPKCGAEHNPFNRICQCGFIFPALEQEYFKWAGNTKVELRKVKDGENQKNT